MKRPSSSSAARSPWPSPSAAMERTGCEASQKGLGEGMGEKRRAQRGKEEKESETAIKVLMARRSA